MEETKEETIIKHIVISGGGVSGLTFYGFLKASNKEKFWDLKNIKTIYATSVGSIMAVIICLNYDWDITDNYLINRPWTPVFNFNLQTIINSIDNCGFFNIKSIEEILKPLLNGKDISTEITMKEFYDLTNIELHFFSTEMNTFEITNFSYKTYPDWKLIDVIYCSCCLPILFSPFIVDEKVYVDGGLLYNNPLKYSILENENTDEILCINKNIINKELNIQPNSTLFDFVLYLIKKMIGKITEKNIPVIKNQINITSEITTLNAVLLASSNKKERIKLIEIGITHWNDYFYK